MNFKSLVLLLVFFVFTQHTFAQLIEDKTQVLLKAFFYSSADYNKSIQKKLALNNAFGPKPKSLKGGNTTIYLKQDGTFAYKLMLEIHRTDQEVGFLFVPFTNITNTQGFDFTQKSLKYDVQSQTWSFKVKLTDGIWHKSDFFATPQKGSKTNFIYTFSSHDEGSSWLVDKEIVPTD